MDLVSYRKSRGLTQDELAKGLGLRSKGYISALESGTYRPSLQLALRIERFTEGLVSASSLRPDAADLLSAAHQATAAP